jgi:hypothetical protein
MKRLMPLLVFAVFALYLAAEIVIARPSSAFDIGAYGRLPVMMNSRVQPIDSVARLALLQIHGAVTVALDAVKPWQFRAPKLSATEWLLELMAKPDEADKRKIFHVRDPQLLAAIDLKATKPKGVSDYSFADLHPKLVTIGKETARIGKLKSGDRKKWEDELLTLRNSIVTYERFKNTLQPSSFMQQRVRWQQPITYDFAAQVGKYHKDLQVGYEAAVARIHGGGEETLDKATEERMRAFARPFMGVASAALVAVIPPSDPKDARDSWRNMGTVIVDSARTGVLPEPIAHYAVMSSAYAQGRSDIFNNQVARYRAWLLGHQLGPEVSRARAEYAFNLLQPLVRAVPIYLAAFALVVVSWLKRSPVAYRSAVVLIALAWTLQTLGVLMDMMLEGRPPITNWYSGIIFCGWAMTLLTALAERWRRNGVALAAAALAGIVALFTAHSLAPGGAVALLTTVFDLSFVIVAAVTLIAVAAGGSRSRLALTHTPATAAA